MPRSRSRSPRDRYGNNRYRGGAVVNSGGNRKRHSRSRSRSPRDRDRDGRDRAYRDRYQQRPERPNKRHSRSRSPSPKAFGNKIVDKRAEPTKRIFDPSELQGKTEDEIEMLKTMGFASFDTTKGKHTEGATNAYGTNIQQKRRYRQYMNRKGGFNRPLDPIA
ncbi:unnamed protein product [Rotaria sp. Silwood2]|nr:unnamed protein product [Rotaria sp. Silwood2]CAF2540574.1 unnamed protein product [Rotaria sp. Silwood2]CAF2792090.1 unnamed protein product [Rotaria sp. Silwood2]CAF2919787.1 unnamed protein product [Rotaria sp. Silwood2]CAF3973189.1 unnamed protein product [Rotaria sp. Silwood2]